MNKPKIGNSLSTEPPTILSYSLQTIIKHYFQSKTPNAKIVLDQINKTDHITLVDSDTNTSNKAKTVKIRTVYSTQQFLIELERFPDLN